MVLLKASLEVMETVLKKIKEMDFLPGEIKEVVEDVVGEVKDKFSKFFRR